MPTGSAAELTPESELAARGVVLEFLAALRRDDLETAASLWDGYPGVTPDDAAGKAVYLRERVDAGIFDPLLGASGKDLFITPSWESTTAFAVVTVAPPADTDAAGQVAGTFVIGNNGGATKVSPIIRRLPLRPGTGPGVMPPVGSVIAPGDVIEIDVTPPNGDVRAHIGDSEVPVTYDPGRSIASVTIPDDATGRVVITISMNNPEIPTAFALTYTAA